MQNVLNLKDAKLDIQSTSKWYDELILFLWGSLGLELICIPLAYLAKLTGWRSDQMSMMLNLLAYSVEFIGFVIYLFLIRPQLGRIILSSFKRKNLARTANGFFYSYVIYLILSLIFVFIKYLAHVTTSDNANQSSLVDLSIFVVAFVLMTVVLAPICEELTYRVGLCSLLKRVNPWLAVIGSGIIFGMIHFDFTTISTAISGGGNEALIKELWSIPPYIFSGVAMGFAYIREGCFTASWSYHFFNNLLSVILIYV